MDFVSSGDRRRMYRGSDGTERGRVHPRVVLSDLMGVYYGGVAATLVEGTGVPGLETRGVLSLVIDISSVNIERHTRRRINQFAPLNLHLAVRGSFPPRPITR